MSDTLPVNETFTTLQGEATWAGTPSWFVRLQGCDVGCPFCDTKYTWALQHSDRVTAAEVIAKDRGLPTWASMSVPTLLAEAAKSTARHTVITGGEPAVFDLTEFSRQLIDQLGHSVQIETSGTQEVRIDPRAWALCLRRSTCQEASRFEMMHWRGPTS